MKTTKKPGHLPTLSSQTYREQHRPLSYYFKEELASLSEFEDNTKKLKTLPTDRKNQESTSALPNFFKNSNNRLAFFSNKFRELFSCRFSFIYFSNTHTYDSQDHPKAQYGQEIRSSRQGNSL